MRLLETYLSKFTTASYILIIWYADPNSVYTFINDYNKVERLSSLCDDSKTATEYIISNLISNKTNSLMLVSSGRHWVTYVGYQTDKIGNPTGIYIKDPWPTTESLSFYPFTSFFFEKYYNKINVEGSMNNKIEGFVNAGTKHDIFINTISKPTLGGNVAEVSYFKKDLIISDLLKFGIIPLGYEENTELEDITIKNLASEDSYVLSFINTNTGTHMVAIEINTYSIISLLKMKEIHFNLFNKKFINDMFKMSDKNNKAEFIYDSTLCNSIFTPLIKFNTEIFEIIRTNNNYMLIKKEI